jgi:hypothetical protein
MGKIHRKTYKNFDHIVFSDSKDENIIPGSVISFFYEKRTDIFPLVLVLEVTEDHISGINLNYVDGHEYNLIMEKIKEEASKIMEGESLYDILNRKFSFVIRKCYRKYEKSKIKTIEHRHDVYSVERQNITNAYNKIKFN